VRWAAPRVNIAQICPNVKPLEKIAAKDVSFARAGVLQDV